MKHANNRSESPRRSARIRPLPGAIGVAALSFAFAAQASALSVLDLTIGRDVNDANIHGDFSVTTSTISSSTDLSAYDVLYVDKKAEVSYFDGRENDVRNAMQAGELGLIAGVASPKSSLSKILTRYGESNDSAFGTELTKAGNAHPTFTGDGIPGGESVTFSEIKDGSLRTYTDFPAGSTVLAKDDDDDPFVVTGRVGRGRFYLTGTNPLLAVTEEPNSEEKQWIHNTIHYVATPIPTPATACIGLVSFALLLTLRPPGDRSRRSAPAASS